MKTVSRNNDGLWQTACLFGAWDEAARRHILACPGDNPDAFADFLAGEIAAKRSHVVHCVFNGERKGSAVFAVRSERGRKVADLQAGGCDYNTPDGVYWKNILPQIEDAARALGCAILITSTARRMVALRYRENGYSVTAIELSKFL